MLKIGDFSKLSRISIRMLRHYDEIRLLTPQTIDTSTGYRYYSEEQLADAGRIVALKDMGFGLSAIGKILAHYDDPQALAEFLQIKQSEVQEEAEEVSRRLLLLDTAIERLRKDETAMNYNVTIKALPERYVASVRQVIPTYDREGILWELLMKETADRNMQIADPCYGMAVFHDVGYKESDVDVEIQMSVVGAYEDTEHVFFKKVPSIEFASAIIKGDYQGLTEVHRGVAQWVRDNAYEFNGAMFCIYHVSPAQTQNPQEWVTEVCYPVKKK
ncbi:MerR family transcriptional regulator [Aminipila butyrica]|uniref:MerR family transcriptional regulator n=1 Tax=Aminipila butyrica TaxID=433296 RepID=A0A858BVG4_9FIRM|nr:MerR family transcriptional regulator [Aminipila butyrica]QIB69923.1 MerR family transcriptional regulator [Aminipila butyrica]